jgi:hypothetical protein
MQTPLDRAGMAGTFRCRGKLLPLTLALSPQAGRGDPGGARKAGCRRAAVGRRWSSAIPASPAVSYTDASLACDGASDPAPYVASGRRLDGGARVGAFKSRRPGKPADEAAPAMAGNRRPPNGCMAGGKATATERSGWPKSGPGQKSPRRGRPKAARGAGNRPGGPRLRVWVLHWLRSRRPRHPSHPRRHCRRGCWHWSLG